MHTLRGIVAACGILCCLATAVRAAEPRKPIKIEFLMDFDPLITFPDPLVIYPARLKSLWLEALAHPEADTQQLAAETIARAHRQGMKGLDTEEVVVALSTLLNEPEQHRLVQLNVAEALIALDKREKAELLFSRLDPARYDYSNLVEPTLAEWDFKPARETWLKRLTEVRTPLRLKLLAIRSLGAVREAQAATPLAALVDSPLATPDVRIEAAASLARISQAVAVKLAEKFAASTGTQGLVDRVVAVRLLDESASPQTVDLLNSLVQDEEPAVGGAALTRLLAIDPEHVLRHDQWGAVHRDANIRRTVARALAARPSRERIALLSKLLDDAHPDNRAEVRESLRRLAADKAMREPVITGATAMLTGDRWRGLEQATLLLGNLDHKPASKRFVELLDFNRIEVSVAAAWGLRELADPDKLPKMLAKAQKQHALRVVNGHPQEGIDPQVALLFEAFGKMKYAPADGLMRENCLKNMKLGTQSRCGAAWALGHLHAGKAPPELSTLLAERLSDAFTMPPEVPLMRAQCAIALGRMQDKSKVEVLKRFQKHDGVDSLVGASCSWALERITGEKQPPPTVPKAFKTNWFLTPTDLPADDVPMPASP